MVTPSIPTKAQLKFALRIASDAELGRLVGRRRQAVHLWPENEPVPELIWRRLREVRPEVFDSSGRLLPQFMPVTQGCPCQA